MMTINLQRYCANDSDPRGYLWKPWRVGEWVYATNGHLAVRVPTADFPDAAENYKAPQRIAGLFAHAFDGLEAPDFSAMPELPKLIKCLACKGTGRLHSIKCPDCDDDGEFVHGRNTYECKECVDDPAGPGRLACAHGAEGSKEQACEYCLGLGYQSLENGHTKIGDADYSAVYLHMLGELPDCRIRPGEPASTVIRPRPAALIFSGGQAILLPYRVK